MGDVVPPVKPGEVWRGHVGGRLVCVRSPLGEPYAWEWVGEEWRPCGENFGHVFREWGKHEHARRVLAEKTAAAERALRVASLAEEIARANVDDLSDGATMGRTIYPDGAEDALAKAEAETNRCHDALRALGVDP